MKLIKYGLLIGVTLGAIAYTDVKINAFDGEAELLVFEDFRQKINKTIENVLK